MEINENEDLEIPEFEGSSDQIEHVNGEWTNKTAKPIKRIKCIIDESIVLRVRDFEYCVNRKLHGSNEFGGYVKWHWDDRGNIIVDDFMVPKQIVGGATVDFREEPTPGYTGVFHKHPTGCTSFSGTDDKYINANNDLSILFHNGTFITGIVNIVIPGTNGIRFQTTLDIVIQRHEVRNDVNVDMIEGRPVLPPKFFRGSRRGFQEQVRSPSPLLPGFGEGFEPIQPESLDDDEDEGIIDVPDDTDIGFP